MELPVICYIHRSSWIWWRGAHDQPFKHESLFLKEQLQIIVDGLATTASMDPGLWGVHRWNRLFPQVLDVSLSQSAAEYSLWTLLDRTILMVSFWVRVAQFHTWINASHWGYMDLQLLWQTWWFLWNTQSRVCRLQSPPLVRQTTSAGNIIIVSNTKLSLASDSCYLLMENKLNGL